VWSWIGLALLFFNIGIYLEFPADTWEHISRVNSWRDYSYIKNNPIWFKSSYYFVYSFISFTKSITFQMYFFRFYHTAISMVLCYLYYSLSRQLKVNHFASIVFVYIQAILFGNNIFNFYRYYSISSTIYAQIGATIGLLLTIKLINKNYKNIIRYVINLLLLLIFIYYNHIQGVVILAISIISISIYLILKLKNNNLSFYFTFIFILLTLFIIKLEYNNYYVLKAIKEGYLNNLYMFNIFNINSLAFDRITQILGLVGFLNLIFGLFLCLKGHIVGFLTIVPFLLLLMPAFTIPLVIYLSRTDSLLVFHRILFSIPFGLATVVYFNKYHKLITNNSVLFILILLILVPVSKPCYNRLYNFLYIVPEDLIGKPSLNINKNSVILTTIEQSFRIKAFGYKVKLPTYERDAYRRITPAYCASYFEKYILGFSGYIYKNPMNYTMYSESGSLSNHWPQYLISLNNTRSIYLMSDYSINTLHNYTILK